MYRDNSGNEFESYEAACYYYGCDTPAQIAAEEAYWAEQDKLAADWAALMGEPQPWADYVPDETCPF
jgi:hypothetical protein